MRTSSKIMIALSGILFVVAGIACLCSWQGTLLSVAWLIGILTLLSGISSLIFYIDARKYLPNSGFTLLSAIADIVMGVLFLGNQLLVAGALPYLFAFLLSMTGIQAIIHSFDFKQAGFSFWWCILVLGVAEAVFAVCTFINPVVGAVAITVLIGVALVSRGINRFAFLAGVSKVEKFFSQRIAAATSTVNR